MLQKSALPRLNCRFVFYKVKFHLVVLTKCRLLESLPHDDISDVEIKPDGSWELLKLEEDRPKQDKRGIVCHAFLTQRNSCGMDIRL